MDLIKEYKYCPRQYIDNPKTYNEYDVDISLMRYDVNENLAILLTCTDGIPSGYATINLNNLDGNYAYILPQYVNFLVKLGIINKKICKVTYGYDSKAILCEININKFV